MEEQFHTLISLVRDEPGVLTRVAGLFRRRGFNIESLSVGHCERPGLSRMTIVVKGDDATVEQVTKQLDKLIEVVNVTDITREEIVARELALFKVSVGPEDRSEIMQVCDIFRAKIVDVAHDSLIVEVTFTTSISLSSCFVTCSTVASSPLTTIVIRDRPGRSQ